MIRRIIVRGTSGAGKTTLARELSERLDLKYVEMDALHHLPNWQERPTDQLQGLIDDVVQEENWVIDGNYASVLDKHIEKADLIIWLDYSFPVVFWRVFKRTLIRSLKHEVLWAGNRESLVKAFFTKDSILFG